MTPAVREGLRHHAAGRLLEAGRSYQLACQSNPADAEALILLGLLARQTGMGREAIRLSTLAVDLQPENAGFKLSLAQAHLAVGDPGSAEACCRKLLELHPGFSGAWCCLGDLEVARGRTEEARLAWEKAARLSSKSARPEKSLGHLLCRQGKFDEAIEMYRQGLVKSPSDAELYGALAAAMARVGKKQKARKAYEEALRLRPEFPEALLNLGNLHYDEGAFVPAAACCRRALQLRPGYVKAWCNLGNALQMLGQLRGAIRCYARALAIDPKTVAAQHNMGNAWMALREPRRAENCFRHAVEMKPLHATHYDSLGNALFHQRGDEEAAACYRRALELNPAYAGAHANLANVLMRLGDPVAMIRHYERAVELDPASAGGHYNLGLARLRQGHYQEGWRDHEWRWDFRELGLRKRRFAQRQWRGEALHGETILLHAEQGLGDTLQFVRYVPLVAERGGRVVLEVQPRLSRLLKNLRGASEVVAFGEPLPEFALHCPLMSLPLAFETTIETIPVQSPYVQADDAETEAARKQWKGDGLRVGVVWAGNPQQRSDDQRSMRLEALLPLAEVQGISWFSLQKGPAVSQMRGLSAQFPLVDASSTSRDLGETAALMATLDLVIGVDTSIAHLAGAMGIPVWIALPRLADWRWMDEGEATPWYPGARLFRQKISGDWQAPVQRIRSELHTLAAASATHAVIGGPVPGESASEWMRAGVASPVGYVTGCGAGMGPG